MLTALRSILGESRALAVDRGDPRYAPHPTPLVHALPNTRDEVVEIVRAANLDGFAVVPVGGNTAPRIGAADAPPYCLLSLEHLDRVVAHEAGDQTLTAEAGLSVETAQRRVGREGQFVAFAPPHPGRATLGGVVAAATEGATAARFGPVRDQLLGVVVVTGDGKLTKAGGRVVKNVTGYDLCRLYAGSRGALAILVELTVRLRPTPEAGCRAWWRFPDEGAVLEAALKLRRVVADLAQLHVLAGAAAAAADGGDGALVVATLEGFAAQVEAAGRASDAALGLDSYVESVPPPAAVPVEAPEDAVVVRLSAPPAAWPGLRRALAPRFGAPLGVVHDVLRGVRETWHAATSSVFVDEPALDAALADGRATLDLPTDPAFHRTLLARFPRQAPGGIDLMRKLKSALDPRGVLNPGRTIFG